MNVNRRDVDRLADRWHLGEPPLSLVHKHIGLFHPLFLKLTRCLRRLPFLLLRQAEFFSLGLLSQLLDLERNLREGIRLE